MACTNDKCLTKPEVTVHHLPFMIAIGFEKTSQNCSLIYLKVFGATCLAWFCVLIASGLLPFLLNTIWI